MLKGVFLGKIGITSRDALANTMLIANAFVWYVCAFGILEGFIAEVGLDYLNSLLVWGSNFGAAGVSALIGAALAVRMGRRKLFLASWTLLGVLSSVVLMLVSSEITSNILIISCLFGVSFGFGMPIAMSYYSDTTNVENRGRLGGIILFINFAGTFMLLGILFLNSIIIRALILAAWRGLGLTFFLVGKSQTSVSRRSDSSYTSILTQRSFLLYFIPWIMFTLADSLSTPVLLKVVGETLGQRLAIIENVLIGVFSITGGFLVDSDGRKRMAIPGFVILGLGYAILGISYQNSISWYFYALVDGTAWGIFYVIFFMTIWGDLAHGAPSAKYYALGALPYILSNFLRLTVGPSIAEIVPAYAIFSFAAFFLFLAVLPLIYAPETLSEKIIQERGLRKYVDTAKKLKEKIAGEK